MDHERSGSLRTVHRLTGRETYLVEEENDRSANKPPRIADRIEQDQRFLHAVDRFVFIEHLIVLGDGDEEHDRRDILEAMNPLLSFRPLSTDVEHAILELADLERSLGDSRRFDSRAQDI